MSIFIARYKKNTNHLVWDKNGQVFRKNLPFEPNNTSIYNFENTDLIVYSFKVALEREPYLSENRVTMLQGYGLSDLEERLVDCIDNNCSLDNKVFHEAFCAVSVTNNSINFCTSASGVDSLFYLDTEDEFIVTNGHNLLQTYIEKEKLPFRKSAFAWMVGRGHLSDFGTYWEGVEKTIPANLFTYNKNNLSINHSDIFQKKAINTADIKGIVKDISQYFDTLMNSIVAEKRIWLSGGKDSRAITSIMVNSSSFKDFDFVTHGESFSPDVMAAKDVAKALNIQDKHTVNLPSLSQGNINIFSRIAEDLSWCNSGSSLADLKSFKQNELLVIGGHENGFKASLNYLNLDDFIKSRKYWVDSKNILSKEMFDLQFSQYSESLKEILKDVPTSRYTQVESLYFRNTTYIASALSASHIATSEVHPFLDGKMIDLLLNVNDKALDSQLIHYLMTLEADIGLESLPYADDFWPDSLKELMQELDLKIKTETKLSYEFKSYYPTEKALGLYKWRIELVKISIPLILGYTEDHKFFDFINYDKLKSLAEKDMDNLTLSDIYFWLGILKACMVHEFGLDSLDFTKRDDLAQKIEKLYEKYSTKSSITTSTFGKTTLSEELNYTKEKLADYEKCIVAMIKVSRGDNRVKDNTTKTNSVYLKECRDSASYKLGHLLLHETKSFRDLLKLPMRIKDIKDKKVFHDAKR